MPITLQTLQPQRLDFMLNLSFTCNLSFLINSTHCSNLENLSPKGIFLSLAFMWDMPDHSIIRRIYLDRKFGYLFDGISHLKTTFLRSQSFPYEDAQYQNLSYSRLQY